MVRMRTVVPMDFEDIPELPELSQFVPVSLLLDVIEKFPEEMQEDLRDLDPNGFVVISRGES